ncbi:hypothetical protein MM213_06920 [Belliella sp. R4-6]|uniref:Uncharacterized protein n=1 Tax=Belliella alkalica TaxID=1730871 RepID=A0ABS9V9V6_9BACT|nr:hypothetical protein [Belliella alkalica]MCH7413207.1 hypothetical protein [Belliella alkalica]
MLQNYISDQEILYRAIKPYPNWWKAEINRPSSAAFKDSRGVSVDRDFARPPEQVIKELRNRFTLKSVVSIGANVCREFETFPVSKPLPNQPEHAEIHRSEHEIELTSGQARKLSKAAKIEYFCHTI